MLAGIPGGMNPPAANWDYVDRLKKLTRMKLVLKGIETRDDARLAREHGVDGIIVSNHGGRALDTGRSTIDALREVVDAAGAGMPVLVDGGFRRGTDVFKALALGANAVGHRPSVCLGAQRVRPAGRRARARHPAGRTSVDDAAVRDAGDSADHPRRWRRQPRKPSITCGIGETFTNRGTVPRLRDSPHAPPPLAHSPTPCHLRRHDFQLSEFAAPRIRRFLRVVICRASGADLPDPVAASSDTSSAPSRATVTPTGRPHASIAVPFSPVL